MGVPVPPGVNMEQNLVSYLQQRRYLVVLDGVWNHGWCNSIKKLPDNGNGSRIIFSTCRRDLASKYISDDLLSRFEGLPLAIVALGSLLSTKQPTPSEFQKVNTSLGSNMKSNSKLGIIRRCCFLHFCKFPEDYSVTRGRLISLWIAEGFVEEERDKTLEEVADAYLDELINRCLVDANTRDFQGVVRRCQVQNLVRECLISISEDASFCKVLTIQNVDRYDHLSHRCIAIHDAFTDSLQSKDFSRVGTLFKFGRENFTTSIFRKTLERLRLLRVLELKDAVLETFPEVNTKIKAVPSSAEKLQNLETLDLRQTFVSKLPKTIRKLHKLVLLLVDHQQDGDQARVGAELFSGIGGFYHQYRSRHLSRQTSQGIAKELGNLTAMGKLGITELERKDGKDLCASIQKMKHLSSLLVISISEEEVLDLGHLCAPPHLTGGFFFALK
ncbi:hypothetical protein PVL29_025955 [Vitis rotundifolia]|uniref:NB-ARC domain-containing protein n=1 Tax=Vitis rotundifolia TaxID=103349 RepID=A0AA39D7Z5_VITRO|nr:hypothetical protein PVL29_025955 [Vitis rotundifolia]